MTAVSGQIDTRRPTEKMTAKKRENHLRALRLLSEHLERWKQDAEARGRTNATTMTVEQISALAWAREIAEAYSWHSVKGDPPKAGGAILVLSDVAGAIVAVRQGDQYLCSCGCEEIVAGTIMAWMPVMPRHVPEGDS